MGEWVRAAEARSLHNTISASRLTIAARWLPPPAPSAAVHHARVPPDIPARSIRGQDLVSTPLLLSLLQRSPFSRWRHISRLGAFGSLSPAGPEPLT